MKAMIDAILAGYGSPVMLRRKDGTQQQIHAFVQPVTERSWQSIRKTMHALGEEPVGKFVYIGPAAPGIGESDTVICAEREFAVRRAETLELAGQALYSWGLLTPCGGEDPWNS